ncbi:unnamed protein product [Hymenolepis diminuta]|uniref:Uncharacterized protein n=1 Tax=Hymenolepis diminuta TaxID=6216 RepID=A0A564YUM7_HYMDI|nr:unnamed protein product [Hymenolepis diminuta]
MPHGGDIYDGDRKRHLISRSLTLEQPLISERNDQDIIPHVSPGLDSIPLVSRSISRQGWTDN